MKIMDGMDQEVGGERRYARAQEKAALFFPSCRVHFVHSRPCRLCLVRFCKRLFFRSLLVWNSFFDLISVQNMRSSFFKHFLWFMPLSVVAAPMPPEENTWVFLGEFIFFRRTDIHNHKLVLNSEKVTCNVCNDFSVLDARQLMEEFHYEPGYRVGVSFNRAKSWTLEATYFTLAEWEGQRSVSGNGTLSFPFSDSNYTQDYTQADHARGEYESRFYNAEFNYWKHATPRDENYASLAWMLGLRYAYLPETFNLIFHKGEDRSNYKIKTQNFMGGVQAGVDIQWMPTTRLSWDLVAKIGEMLNLARDKVFLGDQNNTVTLRRFKKHEYNGTFFVDLAVTLGYTFPSWMNTHVGYQMIYLTGLALAPEQVDKRAGGHAGRLLVNGEAIIHGLYAGLLFSF